MKLFYWVGASDWLSKIDPPPKEKNSKQNFLKLSGIIFLIIIWSKKFEKFWESKILRNVDRGGVSGASLSRPPLILGGQSWRGPSRTYVYMVLHNKMNTSWLSWWCSLFLVKYKTGQSCSKKIDKINGRIQTFRCQIESDYKIVQHKGREISRAQFC